MLSLLLNLFGILETNLICTKKYVFYIVLACTKITDIQVGMLVKSSKVSYILSASSFFV